MVEKKETYTFNEVENVVVKSITILNEGNQIASGFVGISDEELLKLYEEDIELAEKDIRLGKLLNPPESSITEPTESEIAQAEMMLMQAEILEKLNAMEV